MHISDTIGMFWAERASELNQRENGLPLMKWFMQTVKVACIRPDACLVLDKMSLWVSKQERFIGWTPADFPAGLCSVEENEWIAAKQSLLSINVELGPEMLRKSSGMIWQCSGMWNLLEFYQISWLTWWTFWQLHHRLHQAFICIVLIAYCSS